MSKDFGNRNEKKKVLDDREASPFCHERELWWCALGMNIGFEQDGSDIEYRRPVLILKGLSKQTCLIIPLTTSTHTHNLRPTIGLVEDKQACALLSQMRVIDTKRLVRKIGSLDKIIFDGISNYDIPSALGRCANEYISTRSSFDGIRKTVKDML